LNLVVYHADFEGVDANAWIIAPGSIASAESPSVPWATHDAIFKVTTGQGGSHVGAEVIDRFVFAAFIKYSDHAAIHSVCFTGAVFNFANLGDGTKFF